MIFSKKTDASTSQDLTAIMRALDATHVVLWCDRDGNVVEVNEALVTATGVAGADLEGQHYSAILSSGDGNDWAAVQAGKAVSGLATHTHHDGRTLYFDMVFQPVQGVNDRVEKVLVIGTDVTNKTVTQATADSLIRAVDRSQATIEFDLDGIILTANENFLTAMGYTLDEIQGNHHRMFVDPSYASSQEYEDFWAKLARGEFHAGEYRRIGKAGNSVWIQATYNPCLDSSGAPYKVLKFASDITAQKLRSAKYEGQVNAISRSQAVVEFELDGTIIHANENFLEVTGYKLDEVVGKNHKIFVHPDYAASEQFTEFWRELAQGSFKSNTYKRYTKNGDTLWLQASYNPILDLNGNPCKVVKYASVITHWKSELDRVSVALQALSEGDLTVRLPDTQSRDFSQTRQSFNSTVERLQGLVCDLSEAAEHIHSESANITTSGQDLASRCERQAASVEQTSAAMEEISATVNSNTQNAKTATGAARNASQFADKGGKIVDDAIAAMTKIEEGSSEVRKIIEVIDAIAFQTNLLALNAGVEAARAGEAGRGFAVVASEVRALAQRASKSARDISTLIEASGRQVEEGAALVNKTGEALREIVGAVASVSSGIDDIFVSSSEQSEGIQEINQAIVEIDTTTQSTVAIAEQATAAAASLKERASELRELVSFFQFDEPSTGPTLVASRPAAEAMKRPPPVEARPSTMTSGALALDDDPELTDDDGWSEF